MVLALVPLALAGWALAAAALDRYGASRRPRGDWHAIVVAGAPVAADGKPSGALARRTRLAVDLWRDGHAPRIAFTGGPGVTGLAESVAARALAVSLGVPEDAIVVEETSTSTEENALHASRVLGGGRVLVVTDSYHVLRCERVFARYFDHVRGVGGIPPLGSRARMAAREVVVVGIYAARGWMR